jgi:hypothetical protein
MTPFQTNILVAFGKNGGLLLPKDQSTRRACNTLASKKMLRPQTVFETKSLARKNAKIQVAYQITPQGRRRLQAADEPQTVNAE